MTFHEQMLLDLADMLTASRFVSVYDHVDGYGRTKSQTYRLWKAHRDAQREYRALPEGVSPKREKQRHKWAVAKLREFRARELQERAPWLFKFFKQR